MKCNFMLLLSLGYLLCCSCSKDDTSFEDKDLPDSIPPATIPSKGFFVANEDWYGHTNSTVNYFYNGGKIVYRVYQKANPAETLGITTQFATIYGDYIYFLSKQGNRLVVADAKTLKKKIALETIGQGDGRAFVGVSPEIGYISTSHEILVYDIKRFKILNVIDGTGSTATDVYTGQVGLMCRIGNYVFAVKQGQGVFVIDANTNKLLKTISCTGIGSLTQSKDGFLWISVYGEGIWKVDPYSLAIMEKIPLVEDVQVEDPWWGAWSAAGLKSSTKKNILYWYTNNGVIARYDIDKKELTPEFFDPKYADGSRTGMYGGRFGIDPLTDDFVVTSSNDVIVYDSNKTLIKDYDVKGGYGPVDEEDQVYPFWFQAMPFFEDNNSPFITVNRFVLAPNERKEICLSDIVVDADNMSKSIIKDISYDNKDNLVSYELKNDSLIITATSKVGNTNFYLYAQSNGKGTKKKISVIVK